LVLETALAIWSIAVAIYGAAIRRSLMIITISAVKISGETLVRPVKLLDPRVGAAGECA
jgi:hypothetical protein